MHEVDALGAGVEREPLSIPDPDGIARFHRIGDQTVVDQAELDNMGRFFERSVGRVSRTFLPDNEVLSAACGQSCGASGMVAAFASVTTGKGL